MHLLNFFISLLEPIAKLFNKYGVLKAIGYIMIIFFIGFVIYSSWTIVNLDNRIDSGIKKVLTEQSDEKARVHEIGVEKRFANMDEINRALREAMYITGADRACLLEMHNGTNNTAGLPFIYCEMTYEQVREGVMPVDDEYAKINLTRYSFPYYMMQNKYFNGTLDEAMKHDSKIATKMSHDGTDYILVYQVTSKGHVIGYFALTWDKGTPVDITPDKMTKITMLAAKFGPLID